MTAVSNTGIQHMCQRDRGSEGQRDREGEGGKKRDVGESLGLHCGLRKQSFYRHTNSGVNGFGTLLPYSPKQKSQTAAD